MIRNSEFLGGVFWLGIGAYVILPGATWASADCTSLAPALPSSGSAS